MKSRQGPRAHATVSSSGLLEIHAAVLLFGISGLFGKFLTCSPVVIVLGRTAFAAMALGPFMLALKPSPAQDTKKSLLLYGLQGGLLSAHWCAFFYSIQISTVAVGLLTFSTFPLFVTILEPLFFKERLSLTDCLAAVSVFIGLLLVVPSFDFSQDPVKGAFWGTVSGLTFAVLCLANRKNVEKQQPLKVAFYQNLFASLTLIPAVFLLSFPGLGSREIILLAGLGIFCTALAHTLFIKSLIRIKARTAGIITALEPIYGIGFAMVILNEVPGMRTLIGGLIIITATVAASCLGRKNS